MRLHERIVGAPCRVPLGRTPDADIAQTCSVDAVSHRLYGRRGNCWANHLVVNGARGQVYLIHRFVHQKKDSKAGVVQFPREAGKMGLKPNAQNLILSLMVAQKRVTCHARCSFRGEPKRQAGLTHSSRRPSSMFAPKLAVRQARWDLWRKPQRRVLLSV